MERKKTCKQIHEQEMRILNAVYGNMYNTTYEEQERANARLLRAQECARRYISNILRLAGLDSDDEWHNVALSEGVWCYFTAPSSAYTALDDEDE